MYFKSTTFPLFKLDSWVEVICDQQIQLSSIISAHAGAGTDKTAQTSHCTGGHFWYNRTREILTCRYYWKGMCEHIREFISRCDRCQRKKTFENPENSSTIEECSCAQKNIRTNSY